MRVKIAYKKSNCPLMNCENIFKFVRDNCYNSYINTPKMDYTMWFYNIYKRVVCNASRETTIQINR